MGPITFLRLLWKSLFKPRPPQFIHFHRMQFEDGTRDSGPYVCGKNGKHGQCVVTKSGLKDVTCDGCKAWITANPTFPYWNLGERV